MSKVINEDRMLKLVHNFFEHPATLITELVQNAVRAKARKIDINIKDGTLVVCDDGNGCDSHEPLLTLAESCWDAEVEENEQPAGWGLFVLYCLAEKVSLTSRFGTLTIDTALFFNDAAYRERALSTGELVDTSKTAEGFTISATMDSRKMKQIAGISHKRLQYFPIDITLNGNSVVRESVAREYKDYPIKTQYMGNDVFINPKRIYTLADWLQSLDVVWYGILIPGERYSGNRGVINVTQGTPLTPVLPFRTTIKQDEKFTEFGEFARQKIVEYCTEKINSKAEGVEPLIQTMGTLATQEELDRLDYYIVYEEDPYYDTGNSPAHSTSQIVARGERVFTEDTEITIVENGERKRLRKIGYDHITKRCAGNYEMLFLPKGVITKRSTLESHPDWLEIEERILRIDICTGDGDDRYIGGNLEGWYDSMIASAWSDTDTKDGCLCQGQSGTDTKDDSRKIDIIGIDAGGVLSSIAIYYAKDADLIDKIDDSIANHLYYEDGDTYDTQYEETRNAIWEDVQNVHGTFDRRDLLKGFMAITGVRIADVINIGIHEDKMIITMDEGEEKVLLLA